MLLLFGFISFCAGAQDITEGLLFNYQLSGNANDLGMFSMNGELNNVEFGDGPGNLNSEAAYFNGENSVITIPQNEAIEIQYPFSISFWIKRTAFSPGIFTLDDWPNHHSGIWFSTNSNNEIAVNHGNGGGPNGSSRRTYITDKVLELDTWHHIVAIVNDYDNWEVWVDCHITGGYFSGNSGSLINWNQDLGPSFGRKDALNNAPWHYFEGALDEIMMWNRPLSYPEIATICNPDYGHSLSVFYADMDEDGFGDFGSTIFGLVAPEGYVDNNTDCDDSNGLVYPNAPGTNDGIDNDCNNLIEGDEISLCFADFNSNGSIDVDDLLVLISNLNCTEECIWGADLNLDGVITPTDIILFLGIYGQVCE